jgi:replicative DNA helicase
MQTEQNTNRALWSQEVEGAVISCCVNDPRALEDAVDLVKAEQFFAPVNAQSWNILVELWAKRAPVDLMTFSEAWNQSGELAKIEGGVGYLASEYTKVGCGQGALSYWAEQLRDYWRRREIVRIATNLVMDAKDFQRSSDEVLDAGEAALLSMRIESKESGLIHCSGAVDRAVKRIELAHKKRGGVVGLATGFRDFDRMTGGLKPGQLIIVAARPSMGKSAFATNIAEHVCLELDQAVALFTLEMTSDELMERVLCGQSDINLQRVRDGFMSKEEVARLGKKMGQVSGAPLYLDETPSLSIASFRARARRAVARHGVKLLIVDYLQLMKGASKRALADRRLEIDEISSGLKATAKELKVPVIALSQLNRDAEETAAPKLSHLRESGSIEQDADVVALLHRPERVVQDKKRKEELKGQATLYVAKQRNGPVGPVELYFHGETTQFRNLTPQLYSNRENDRQGGSASSDIRRDKGDEV